MPIITCIEDLRQLHQKNTPKPFYDYVDAGSYSEGTYRANSADLAPRGAMAVFAGLGVEGQGA